MAGTPTTFKKSTPETIAEDTPLSADSIFATAASHTDKGKTFDGESDDGEDHFDDDEVEGAERITEEEWKNGFSRQKLSEERRTMIWKDGFRRLIPRNFQVSYHAILGAAPDGLTTEAVNHKLLETRLNLAIRRYMRKACPDNERELDRASMAFGMSGSRGPAHGTGIEHETPSTSHNITTIASDLTVFLKESLDDQRRTNKAIEDSVKTLSSAVSSLNETVSRSSHMRMVQAPQVRSASSIISGSRKTPAPATPTQSETGLVRRGSDASNASESTREARMAAYLKATQQL
eukprot:TRINITY_DN2398_c0_g1_i1.p2 TRINITY_DN2398_c0_g1~~TRINITY_DN2398_c0_g1_i1.p2  ORF type:complete len:291 (+),score=22.41 TRINITY_DN2398_c0_g1_i1:2462-3334(+)